MEQTPPASSPGGIGLKFLLGSASIIVVLAGLKASQSLLAPFFLAVFFALVLMPPLRWLKQKGLSDWVAILVLSGVVFLFGFLVIAILSSSLNSFAGRIPTYQEKLGKTVKRADSWIDSMKKKFENMESTFLESVPKIIPEESERPVTEKGEIDPTPVLNPLSKPNGGQSVEETPADHFSLRNMIHLESMMSYVKTAVQDLLNLATVSFLIAVMVIFMLVEASQLPAKIRAAFGERDLSNEYFKRIADDTWNYTKIKTIVSLLTGIFTTIGLWLLGVEYSLLWGLLMFFLNYIPNIGPIIASIPPILLALVDQGFSMCLIVTTWLILVNMVFGYGVEPRFLGEGLGISDLVVLLSLVFWGWLLGPIGMFLSAPLTMVVKIVLQNDLKTRWIAILLSNRVEHRAS